MQTGDRGIAVFTEYAHVINGLTDALREQLRAFTEWPTWHETRIVGPLMAAGLPRCDKQLPKRREDAK
jgi:hypothetical protein